MQQRLTRALFKYAGPLFLFVAVLTPIIGMLRPWQPATAYLSTQTGQTPLAIGFDCGLSACKSVQYILVPAAFSQPTSVTITQHGNAPVKVVTNKYGFLVWLARFVGVALLTWWFWFHRQPPNNSFKPKPLRGSA